MKLANLMKIKDVSIEEVDKNTLVDCSSIAPIETDDIESKLNHYLQQIQNPYCFRFKDMAIKITFNADGKTLDDILKTYFINEKNQGNTGL